MLQFSAFPVLDKHRNVAEHALHSDPVAPRSHPSCFSTRPALYPTEKGPSFLEFGAKMGRYFLHVFFFIVSQSEQNVFLSLLMFITLENYQKQI